MNERLVAAGFIILQNTPSGGLDFVDCTPTINRTIEDAQQELREWYADIPDAAIYRVILTSD